MTTRDALHLDLIGHSDLGGHGDGMQIMRHGDALYVGHLGTSGAATSTLDVSDLKTPQLIRQSEAPTGSHSHKVQVAGDVLLVNVERFRGGDPFSAGMHVHDISDPFEPKPVGWFDSGGEGVHRIVYTGGRYAYVSAVPEGFEDRIWIIVDLEDLEHPTEAGRWWWPGMWLGGGEVPDWPQDRRFAAHHALLAGDIAYLAYGDAGMVILDIGDIANPRPVAKIDWRPGGDTHTCLPLPGRRLVVVTDESVKERCLEEEHLVRIIDVSDLERPRVVATCPVPQGDFCERGLRFGPHNLHENRPGTYASETIVFVTYFNAGLRVYDISKADEPREIAYWVPETPPGQEAPQINDLFVDADGTIFVSDRVNGGLYVLEPDEELRAAMDGGRS
jgi:hypothetical protein